MLAIYERKPEERKDTVLQLSDMISANWMDYIMQSGAVIILPVYRANERPKQGGGTNVGIPPPCLRNWQKL